MHAHTTIYVIVPKGDSPRAAGSPRRTKRKRRAKKLKYFCQLTLEPRPPFWNPQLIGFRSDSPNRCRLICGVEDGGWPLSTAWPIWWFVDISIFLRLYFYSNFLSHIRPDLTTLIKQNGRPHRYIRSSLTPTFCFEIICYYWFYQMCYCYQWKSKTSSL